MTDVSRPSSASEILSEIYYRRDRPQEPRNHEMIAGQMAPSVDVPIMEQTGTQIRRRPVRQSDSKKHLIAEPPGSHSKHMHHAGSLQGNAAGSAKPARPSYKCKGDSIDLNCACRHESGRWQQGQWSGEDWETERFTTKKAGVCKCLAGAAADCTAVCCCPLSLLHLLALACIKLPSIVVIRTLRKVKAKIRKKRKCKEVHEDDAGPTTPFTPSLSCRESMEEVTWTPTSGFADPRMWQEYFGADADGFSPH